MSTVRAIALLLLWVTPAAAQGRGAVWPLPRLRGEILVDGRSDEPAWQAVAPLRMTVYLPAYGAVPSERTDARIGYDADAIYVMVDAWEGHEGGVRASSMIRDDDSPGDFINVTLDTFGDRQNAASIGLHARLGFRVVGTFEGIGWKHGRWLDGVQMQRALGDGAASEPTA